MKFGLGEFIISYSDQAFCVHGISSLLFQGQIYSLEKYNNADSVTPVKCLDGNYLIPISFSFGNKKEQQSESAVYT